MEYRYEHTVTFAETNLVGNVYFSHYASWQGACRERFILDHAPGVVQQLRTGELALVTTRLAIEYIEECFAGDHILILMRQSQASARNGFGRIQMEFTYRRSETTVALGEQTVACLRRAAEGYQPCELPSVLSEALSRFGNAHAT